MNSVLVLGDSHALVFSSEHMRYLFPDHVFEVTSVGGATVSGLQNPNAVTQAMPQYLAALQTTTAKTVIVMLGEVDTGFVIWYRAQKHGSSVERMLEKAVGNYQNFLQQIAKTNQVICISTPLPTIRDDMQWGDVANLRKEVTASLSQRTRLTIRFNSMMEAFCLEEGINHLNFDTLSTDETGCLKESLRNPDPSDHHYDPTAHAKMIEPLLKPLLLQDKHREPQCTKSATPAANNTEKTSFISNLLRMFLRSK